MRIYYRDFGAVHKIHVHFSEGAGRGMDISYVFVSKRLFLESLVNGSMDIGSVYRCGVIGLFGLC